MRRVYISLYASTLGHQGAAVGSSQGQRPPAEEVFRKLLSFHPASVAGDEGEASVEKPLYGLHGRKFAVAIQGEPAEEVRKGWS